MGWKRRRKRRRRGLRGEARRRRGLQLVFRTTRMGLVQLVMHRRCADVGGYCTPLALRDAWDTTPSYCNLEQIQRHLADMTSKQLRCSSNEGPHPQASANSRRSPPVRSPSLTPRQPVGRLDEAILSHDAVQSPADPLLPQALPAHPQDIPHRPLHPDPLLLLVPSVLPAPPPVVRLVLERQ